MDILTHTLSGFAVGTVIASFSKKGVKEKLLIIGTGGLAGALPDLDAISLWSRFDSTIGNFFKLETTGREIYSGKYRYSHHAFMHSIAAALFITLLLGIISYVICNKFRKQNISKLYKYFIKNKLIHYSFILGFLIHLIEDMPTPASVWGGVNLFWPAKTYVGGAGKIWWWNNYDLFLIVLGVVIINSILHTFSFMNSKIKAKIITLVFILGFTLSLKQIHAREYNFAYTGHTNKYSEFEAKSKAIQKEILGKRLHSVMESFDNKLSIYF